MEERVLKGGEDDRSGHGDFWRKLQQFRKVQKRIREVVEKTSQNVVEVLSKGDDVSMGA